MRYANCRMAALADGQRAVTRLPFMPRTELSTPDSITRMDAVPPVFAVIATADTFAMDDGGNHPNMSLPAA